MDSIELIKYDVIINCMAVTLYLASTTFFVYSVIFKKDKSLNPGLWLALIGLIPHSVALGIRWYAIGHGPYLQKMESFSSIAWVAIIMFLIFTYKVPKLKSIGVVVLLCCLLIMIWGFSSDPLITNFLAQAFDKERSAGGIEANLEIAKVPPTFQGLWFIIHICSTMVSVGAILIALGTSVFYLMKKKKQEAKFYQKLPSLDALDTYTYMFAGFGFIFWTVMVVSGALWAEQSWGRYWGWDPIETWSLITWLLFGIYLHLRRFFRWRGEKAAWLMMACFIVSVITLFFIPFVMETVHSEYLL